MTMTTRNWISLPAATVPDLEAELARRREEAERAARAAAEHEANRDKERKRLMSATPGLVRDWHKQMAALVAAGESRPTPDLRGRARGALLRREWQDVLDNDATCAQLQRLATEAGDLLSQLEGLGAPEDLLREVDTTECAAFGAIWQRIHQLAGVSA